MIRRSKAAALVAAATLVRGVTKVGPGIAGSYPAHHPAAKQARSFRRTVMAGGLAGLLAAAPAFARLAERAAAGPAGLGPASGGSDAE